MKILLIHNKYLQYGGEDVTLANEVGILSSIHQVKVIEFDNKELAKSTSRLATFSQMFYNRKSYDLLKKEVLSFNPDIIHVHNFYYVVSPSVFYLANDLNVPIVATVQNYRLICSGAFLLRDEIVCTDCIQKTFPLSGIIHKCNRGSFSQSLALTMMTSYHKIVGTWKERIDKVIVVTNFNKERLVNSSLKLDPNKVAVKPNSVVDVGESNLNEREDYFLFVGRLSDEKGIKVLIEAFSKSNHHIKILGGGPLNDYVTDASKTYSNIEFLGFRKKEDIISYMRKCKALVFPSLWYEGLPLTILEAFSTGTPIICSDIDNLNEIVSHNFNGILFKTGDPTSLLSTVNRFIDKSDELFRLYENARATFLNKYTQELNLRNLEEIYSELISLRSTKI